MKSDFLLILSMGGNELLHTRLDSSAILLNTPRADSAEVKEFIEASGPGDYLANEARSFIIVRVQK